jgi:DNA gyrase subunit A
MLTTSGGMVIRTRVSTMRTIGRNTQGVRLIKLNEGDTVSSLAKLPEEELGDDAVVDPDRSDGETVVADTGTLTLDDAAELPPHHLMDNGVAEAADHLDLDRNGDLDAPDDETSTET